MRRKEVIGWREWVLLPDLTTVPIRAKIDSGARTSAIHAFNIEPYEEDGDRYVRFDLHPRKRHRAPSVACTAKVADERVVKNSGGHEEHRYVVETRLQIGAQVWPIELTLANRDTMTFRLLIGREALRGKYWVDAGKSYVQELGGAARRRRKTKRVRRKEPELFK